jgi:hypothetical protein
MPEGGTEAYITHSITLSFSTTFFSYCLVIPH